MHCRRLMLRKRALILVQFSQELFRRLHIALDAYRTEQASVPHHRKRRVDRLQLLSGRGFILIVPPPDGLLRLQSCNGRAVILIHIKNVQQLFALHLHVVRKIHHPAKHAVIVYDPQIRVIDLHTVRDRIQRTLQQLFAHIFPPCKNALRTIRQSAALDHKPVSQPQE